MAINLGFLGSLAATGAGLAGQIFSGRSAAQNADRSYERQIAWERERATHAHQWEVADLRAAGLNPILSATGGSGASTGSINPPVADVPDYGSTIANGVNSARRLSLEKIQTDANIQKINSEKEVNDEQIRVSQLNNTTQMYNANLQSKLAYANNQSTQSELVREEATQLAERAGLIALEYARQEQLIKNSKNEGERIAAQTRLANLEGNLSVLQGLYTVALTNFTQAGIEPRAVDAEYQQAFKGHPLIRRAIEGGGRIATTALGGVLPFMLGRGVGRSAGAAAATPPIKPSFRSPSGRAIYSNPRGTINMPLHGTVTPYGTTDMLY